MCSLFCFALCYCYALRWILMNHSPISSNTSVHLEVTYRLIGMGISIIYLRQSSDRLTCIMEYLIPISMVRRRLSQWIEAHGCFTGSVTIVWLLRGCEVTLNDMGKINQSSKHNKVRNVCVIFVMHYIFCLGHFVWNRTPDSPDLSLTPLAAFSTVFADRSAKNVKKATRGVRFKSGLYSIDWDMYVILVAISGTHILVPYPLIQVTATQIGFP